jgi:hypothetical protein
VLGGPGRADVQAAAHTSKGGEALRVNIYSSEPEEVALRKKCSERTAEVRAPLSPQHFRTGATGRWQCCRGRCWRRAAATRKATGEAGGRGGVSRWRIRESAGRRNKRISVALIPGFICCSLVVAGPV